jgi:hypothetical protein
MKSKTFLYTSGDENSSRSSSFLSQTKSYQAPLLDESDSSSSSSSEEFPTADGNSAVDGSSAADGSSAPRQPKDHHHHHRHHKHSHGHSHKHHPHRSHPHSQKGFGSSPPHTDGESGGAKGDEGGGAKGDEGGGYHSS